MTAAAGLAPSQLRAIGLTLGALYAFHAARGILTNLQAPVHPDQHALSAVVWLPGVLALFAFIANRVDLGQRFLAVAAIAYPVAIPFWPLVTQHPDNARVEFWIHQIPGLAAVAAIVTLPLWYAMASLVVNCLLVEWVMRTTGIVEAWNVTVVRIMFAIFYSGFFFVLMLFMLRDITRVNRVLARSSREQAEAAMMQARDDEIGRLDRLTHDFVLSLLSSAAEGVPTDKLRVQADAVRRQLSTGLPGAEDVAHVADVVSRIRLRTEREGVPVTVRGTPGDLVLPRVAAVELEAAVAEAVRNTVRHASSGQRLAIEVNDPGIEIEIADDGPGFDPTKVRARLGVSQSILTRMNSLGGGWADIDSAVGRGTVVTIGWSPE